MCSTNGNQVLQVKSSQYHMLHINITRITQFCQRHIHHKCVLPIVQFLQPFIIILLRLQISHVGFLRI